MIEIEELRKINKQHKLHSFRKSQNFPSNLFCLFFII